MSGPLEGIRILDMTVGQHGPHAGVMLADMGAEVIKIEEPTTGDGGRYLRQAGQPESGPCSYFETMNRGKKGIAIDLKKGKGKEIVYRLVEKSDVFVTNFREAAVKQLKVDYKTLSRINPKLVYALAYGLGKYGPETYRPFLDMGAQARGGMMSISGDGPPGRAGAGMADQVGAGILAYGIMLGLFARERTGLGQEVNTSLLGSQVWLGSLAVNAYLFYGQLYPKLDRTQTTNPLWNIYQCQDGKWICLAMLGTDRYWPDFCAVMGLERLEKDPKFETHEKRTVENGRQLLAILDKLFASKPREEWMRTLDQREFIWAPVHDYSEVVTDPQVLANEYVAEQDHPIVGKTKVVGMPVRLSKTPGKVGGAAPELGQHTEEVLVEIGGYSWEEIAKLKEEGVI